MCRNLKRYLDCAGICDGDSVENECGVCGGDALETGYNCDGSTVDGFVDEVCGYVQIMDVTTLEHLIIVKV